MAADSSNIVVSYAAAAAVDDGVAAGGENVWKTQSVALSCTLFSALYSSMSVRVVE